MENIPLNHRMINPEAANQGEHVVRACCVHNCRSEMQLRHLNLSVEMTPKPSDVEKTDFVTATMSIFLAVSPTARLHTRCRSLNQMDRVGLKNPDSGLNVPLQQRRHNLARSQVNSSEYFSVAFEIDGQDASGHEFLLAAKGTSLAEALGPVCNRRGIELSNVQVMLEQYKTPLPILTTDTAWLGGKHITLREKDSPESRGNKLFSHPSRKTSRSCKGRTSFFSVSTEEGTVTSDTLSTEPKSKSSRQRWSGLFGNSKDSKMEMLVEKLNNYSKFGIPQVKRHHDEDIEESLYKLEDDWKEIVSKKRVVSDIECQQQAAIWELVQTEVAYIHTLKLVTDLFLACLISLQKVNLLLDIEKSRLFSNIEEISSCNFTLWSKYLLPMLACARENATLLDPNIMLEAFLKCEELFGPYVVYCSEQSECQKYCREKTASNELFTAYLAWCETQKDCHRLRLLEILVKPMQRLTKYSLLLKAILKHTTLLKQKENLELMIERIDSFVNNVNTTLKQKEDIESLRSIIARIESYDVVETKDEDLEKLIKPHNELDLQKPMPGCNPLHKRQLIAEADLKLKDHNNSKVEVHCIILTDILLLCKLTRGSHLKIIRPPYQVHRLLVEELARDTPTLAVVHLSEYSTPMAAFLLTSPDPKTIKNFAVSLRRAEGLYNTAKQASDDTWRVEPDSSGGCSSSIEMVEGCSPISNASRGLSVESEVRPVSHSSDEALPHALIYKIRKKYQRHHKQRWLYPFYKRKWRLTAQHQFT
ncbi:pleckstrin homology domain-containing family G member 5 isoform X3 [Halyomorpha halys]|uniref:pleckstrin homology domain-containing family G member 5 isoform X3 n=1 Tax=Halyomorpha halys TaxID=286706 RepID=UPI0006D4F583|nr:pleckstrin homology domain-containing family G member 5-like isoform X3 [Halyomorpha halys]